MHLKYFSYNILVAESPKLRQLLRHEQLCLANGGEHGLVHLLAQGPAGQIVLEITDRLLELENLVFQ